jgi:hypothetical protein
MSMTLALIQKKKGKVKREHKIPKSLEKGS